MSQLESWEEFRESLKKRQLARHPQKVAEALQRAEAAKQYDDANWREDLILPRATGEIQSHAAYKLDEQAKQVQKAFEGEHSDYFSRLKSGPQEVVENPLDVEFIGNVNGAKYRVPPRASKRLPSPLAQHFRHKLQLISVQQRLDQTLGGGANKSLYFDQFQAALRDAGSPDIDPADRDFYF
jgi:hypothetical protein